MQKRAIAVHDISCVGRCSLTVALPVLSAAGLNTAIVPTALLSTHTGGFTGFTHLDLTSQLRPIADHIATLGLHFDAFYSGYLASGAQVNDVLYMIDALCDDQSHIFVDPAFADNGKMYALMDETMPGQMRRLCERADTIIPNLTEACLILGIPYPGADATEDTVREICAALQKLGPQNVIVTDVNYYRDKVGVAVQQQGADPVFLYRSRLPGSFHGTGDVLASLLLGALMNGRNPVESTNIALDFTHLSIEKTIESSIETRYGVEFETLLPDYGRLLISQR